MIAVYRYTEGLQKYFHAKTKPEPWLHFVHVSGTMDKWSIYVWDTRQVVEEGHDYRPIPKGAQKASDNHEMLKDAKDVSLIAAFDGRYFIVDDFGTRLDKPKVLEVFNDKKAADAWYDKYLKEVEDINKQLLKVIADTERKYAKLHPDDIRHIRQNPQELMQMEHDAKSEFYAKQPEHHRLGHNIDVRNAKWMAQNEPELYKTTIK